MAQGDFIIFNQWKKDLGLKIHDLDNDTFKLGLITNAVTPAANTADPRWGAGGSTNFSSNQVTPGGNYATGGPTLANPTLVESAGVVTWDADNITISSSGSNPTNARWGIVYNDTATGKQAVGFVDLGTVVDLTAAPFAGNVNAAGLVVW
jgi:hypothetical protein